MSVLTDAPSVQAPSLARRRSSGRLVWLCVAVGVLAVAMAASVAVGSRTVAFADIAAALTGSVDTVEQTAVAARLPRTLLGAIVGAALGLAGALLQGVTRNPLAGPGILGINMGASLAVVVGIVMFGLSTAAGYVWVAIAGAGVTAVFVYAVGSLGRGGATPLKLALAGAATTAALTSFIAAVSLPRVDLAESIRSWQIGGIGGATYATIGQILPFIVVGLVLSLVTARALNSLALGDELAAGLGERVALARIAAGLAAVLLSGAATAAAGPIGFVGLVVPHVCRLLVGIDHRWLLPFSAVVGACLLLISDVVGRVVANPSELDVSIVTALLGAPWFIYIVRRHRTRAL